MRKFLMMTTLAVLIPFIVFAFLGCMKNPDHTPDYGPEVSWERIQQVWTLDTPPEPLSMKVGQYVSIDYKQMIDVQTPTVFRQRSDKVVFREENDLEVQWKFHTKENIFDFQSTTWKSSEQTQDPLYYDKQVPQSLSAIDSLSWPLRSIQTRSISSMKPQSHIKVYSLQALKAEDSTTPKKVTYHNLNREDGFMPVPLVVQERPDCGGVKNCQTGLRFMRISFDRVVWDSEQRGTKTAFRITYSPDIPTYIYDWTHPLDKYPTNQYQFCAQTWIDVQNGSQTQVVPVQECAEVVDFQFGN